MKGLDYRVAMLAVAGVLVSGCGATVVRRPGSVTNGATIVVVVVRTRDSNAKGATTFTTRGAAEISSRGVEETSVDRTSFMVRGFEVISSGNSDGVYDPTNNTVFETTQYAEDRAELQDAAQQLRQLGKQKSSHQGAQTSRRTTTTIIGPSSKQYDSFVGTMEPGLDGLSEMFVPHVSRRERVVARVTIDGHPALKLAEAWYLTDMGMMGEVGGYGTMYVTPRTYEPIRDVLPNAGDTVMNDWLSYRVLPATRANLQLVSLTGLHPSAKVIHSAAEFVLAQNYATDQ